MASNSIDFSELTFLGYWHVHVDPADRAGQTVAVGGIHRLLGIHDHDHHQCCVSRPPHFCHHHVIAVSTRRPESFSVDLRRRDFVFLIIGSFWTSHGKIPEVVVSLTGVANMGIAPQILTGYPLLGGIIAILALRRKPA